MRKRGKYGLNNVIDSCKTGSFLPYFVGNLEWGILKLPSSRDAAAAGEGPGSCCTGRSRQLSGFFKYLSTRKRKIGLRWITFDDIMIALAR